MSVDAMSSLRLEVQEGWPDLPNLIDNPDGDGGAWGWSVSEQPQYVVRGTSGGIQVDTVAPLLGGHLVGTSYKAAVPAGGGYVRGAVDLVSQAVPPGFPVELWLAYTVDDDNLVDGIAAQVPLNLGSNDTGPVAIPAGAVSVVFAVIVDMPPAGSTVDFTFNNAVMMFGTQAEVTASDPLAEPPWTNVLGPTHAIDVERDELNLGTLTATIYSPTLDPAVDDLIRPGKRIRLQMFARGVWQNLFTGKLGDPSTVYRLKDPLIPENKRVQISIQASDATSDLANAPRPTGVGTIDDLRAVLLGTGVPWNVNGNTDAVDPDTVTTVAVNGDASALDQIAITRDSVLGYAWVDRNGTVQAWDRDELSATVAAVLDEADYSDLDIDFDLQRCINTVRIKHVRINPGTGETEEVDFGPYVDPVSAREWRPRQAEFRVQGVDEAALPAYAADVLAAASTPAVRINSVVVPIRDAAEMLKAERDLYDLVTTSNTAKGIVQSARVVSVRHSIRAERDAVKWLMTLGFTKDGGVALPQRTPSPTAGGSKTVAQLVRPVGEITAVYGTPAMIARDYPGWLICNGAAYDVDQYPRLHAWLQELVAAGFHTNAAVLPNFTDRFLIGAGTKALGTSGGDATKTIQVANLPPHTHTITTREGASGFGAAASLAAPSATGTATTRNTAGTTGATATPLDVMPPWRAAYVIIRAA